MEDSFAAAAPGLPGKPLPKFTGNFSKNVSSRAGDPAGSSDVRDDGVASETASTPALDSVLLADLATAEAERDAAQKYREMDEARAEHHKARVAVLEADLAAARADAEKWHREALDWQQAKSEADDAWEEARADAERLAEATCDLLGIADGMVRIIGQHTNVTVSGYDAATTKAREALAAHDTPQEKP